MTTIMLREQHPGDVLDHAVGFASWLADGDTLTGTPTVTAGAGIVVGSPAPATAIDGDDVVFWLSGGTSGETYDIEVTANTTGGRTKVVDCQITITDPTP